MATGSNWQRLDVLRRWLSLRLRLRLGLRLRQEDIVGVVKVVVRVGCGEKVVILRIGGARGEAVVVVGKGRIRIVLRRVVRIIGYR